MLLQVPVVIYYAHQSPGHLLENHSVLFLSAFCMPIVKSVMLMMVSETLYLPTFISFANLFNVSTCFINITLPPPAVWDDQESFPPGGCHHVGATTGLPQPLPWTTITRVLCCHRTDGKCHTSLSFCHFCLYRFTIFWIFQR